METRTRAQYHRRRSTAVKWGVAIALIIMIIVIVVTVSVTVSNKNKREGSTGAVPPSDRPELITPTAAAQADMTTEPVPTTFSARSKTENVTLSFRAFTSDRLEVVLNVTFQYHIGPETAHRVYALYGDIYGDGFEGFLEANAVDELKAVATQFSARDYMAENQSSIKRELGLGLQRILEGTCCKPSCETLPEGCVDGCVPLAQCTEQQMGIVDAVILWSHAVEIPGFPGR